MRLEVAGVDIDIERYVSDVRSDDFWLFAAQNWHDIYAPWVPWRTGALYTQAEFSPGEIAHTVPYAQRVYDGDFNFRRDVHPYATGHWDMAAAETQLPVLVAAMQQYVDEGRLGIGQRVDA